MVWVCACRGSEGCRVDVRVTQRRYELVDRGRRVRKVEVLCERAVAGLTLAVNERALSDLERRPLVATHRVKPRSVARSSLASPVARSCALPPLYVSRSLPASLAELRTPPVPLGQSIFSSLHQNLVRRQRVSRLCFSSSCTHVLLLAPSADLPLPTFPWCQDAAIFYPDRSRTIARRAG